MKVNGKEIKGIGFAFDGCHKIYVVANEEERWQAKIAGYEMHDLHDLPKIWYMGCPLRFISTWSLTDYYVHQGEQATFTE